MANEQTPAAYIVAAAGVERIIEVLMAAKVMLGRPEDLPVIIDGLRRARPLWLRPDGGLMDSPPGPTPGPETDPPATGPRP